MPSRSFFSPSAFLLSGCSSDRILHPNFANRYSRAFANPRRSVGEGTHTMIPGFTEVVVSAYGIGLFVGLMALLTRGGR